MNTKELINLEEEGNKLTLDQYNDLKALAKQLVPDGSVKTLINEALHHYERSEGNQMPLPFFGLTDHLFPRTVGSQSNIKKRDLAGKCDVKLLRAMLEEPTDVIQNQEMIPEDGLIGSSFILKPRSQLGSFIYVMTFDYAYRLLELLGNQNYISVDDRIITQDYSIIYFDDNAMIEGTMVRTKASVVIRNGKKPAIGREVISQYRVSIPMEHETVSLILARYDFAKRKCAPARPKPFKFPSPFSSGIISSKSVSKELIRSDDDFER